LPQLTASYGSFSKLRFRFLGCEFVLVLCEELINVVDDVQGLSQERVSVIFCGCFLSRLLTWPTRHPRRAASIFDFSRNHYGPKM